MEISLLDRQSLFDIALQCCGSFEAAFDIALLNNRSLTDDVPDGTLLALPKSLDNNIVRHYAADRILPATAWSDAEMAQAVAGGEGIDFMGIEFDFLVR